MDYWHQNGIIHTGLKFENILLDGEVNIKIADFELFNQLTSAFHMDTDAYFALEIFLEKKYGPEVDVWVLGITLYVLLMN